MDRGVWWASVHGVTKESDGLVTKGQHAADTSDLPMSLFLVKLFECFVAGKNTISPDYLSLQSTLVTI